MKKDIDYLIINNTNLIYLVLQHLHLYNKYDEYYDIGMLGLVKGANKYDASFGVKPGTYLYKCIYNEVLSEIKKKNKVVTKELSLDGLLEQNNYYDTKYVSDNINIDNYCILQEKLVKINALISKLSIKERLIINSTFELNGCEYKTQKKLSAILGISQPHISRLKKKICSRIKNELQEYYI